MSGYWIDSPDNPFNQMSYTRGGGGYDNASTRESNERRASAMKGAGASALPQFATVGVARALNPKGLSVVGENVIAFEKQPQTAGAGSASVKTEGGSGGSGAGSAGVQSAPRAGGAGSGSRLVLSGPLTPKIKDTVTQVMAGGDWWQSNPWFSDAEEWTARYGEGEIAETLFLLTNVTADTGWNIGRGANAIAEWARSENGRAHWREDAPQYDNGWVSYDGGASWSFAANDGTEPFMWDNGGRNPSVTPWR